MKFIFPFLHKMPSRDGCAHEGEDAPMKGDLDKAIRKFCTCFFPLQTLQEWQMSISSTCLSDMNGWPSVLSQRERLGCRKAAGS